MEETRNNKIINKTDEKQMDSGAKQNAVGFFDLLLKIDMRNHPERYKKTNNPQKEK